MSFKSLLSLALLAVTASAQLSVTLSGPGAVDGVENLKVVAKLTNTGDETLKLVNTPQGVLSKLPTNTFTITNAQGQSPAFSGIQAKFPLEKVASSGSPSSFTILEAGQSIDLEHDLSKNYNFTSTGFGDYKIEASNLFYGVDAAGELNEISADVTPFSSAVTGGNLAVARTSQFRRRATYAGCSSKEQSTLKYVAQAATDLAVSAQTSLNSSSTGPSGAYSKWFGEWTTARYATLTTHFAAIAADNFSDWHYDCSTCDRDDYYSFVYPDDPGRIFLCDSFWDLDLTGTDSQAGTLVNEASRFTKNAATEDYASGQSACKKLAKENPGKAVANADSHEYFAEKA